jgi:DNA-binding NtrC family response regulator
VILSETEVLKPDDFYLKPPVSVSIGSSFSTIEEMEKQMIQQAIENNNGNLTAAAEQLGITRQTLYNKLKDRNSDK